MSKKINAKDIFHINEISYGMIAWFVGTYGVDSVDVNEVYNRIDDLQNSDGVLGIDNKAKEHAIKWKDILINNFPEDIKIETYSCGDMFESTSGDNSKWIIIGNNKDNTIALASLRDGYVFKFHKAKNSRKITVKEMDAAINNMDFKKMFKKIRNIIS